MGLSVLLRLFKGNTDGGLFRWLAIRDTNRTIREVEHDRNLTELEIRRDENRTQLELERERRLTALQIIGQQSDGAEYRDSTPAGRREIRKTPVPPNTLFVLSDKCGGENESTSDWTELAVQQPPPRDLPIGPGQSPRNELGLD
jgi:hypothetical protein